MILFARPRHDRWITTQETRCQFSTDTAVLNHRFQDTFLCRRETFCRSSLHTRGIRQELPKKNTTNQYIKNMARIVLFVSVNNRNDKTKRRQAMKKLLATLCAVGTLGITVPAFALFTNGGFETGNFSGWSFDYGYRNYNGSISWGQANNGKSAVIDATGTQPGQTLDVNPYVGTYMARINNYDWDSHVTKIFQTDAITSADKFAGSILYVDWGAMLPNPGGHATYEQPYFKISVSVNGTAIDSFDAYGNQTSGWTYAGTNYGEPMYYKSGVYSLDLNSYNIGDLVTVEMIASDCSLTGHGGYAFLDGIGTTYQPPTVPEPSTVALLGLGLAGIAVMGKRMRK
jgi:hypothetical protein